MLKKFHRVIILVLVICAPAFIGSYEEIKAENEKSTTVPGLEIKDAS